MDECKPLARGASKAGAKGTGATVRYQYRVVAWGAHGCSGYSAGAYTRPLSSSTLAVLVTPTCVPVSNRLGEYHAPKVSTKLCLRLAEKRMSVSPWYSETSAAVEMKPLPRSRGRGGDGRGRMEEEEEEEEEDAVDAESWYSLFASTFLVAGLLARFGFAGASFVGGPGAVRKILLKVERCRLTL